MPNLLRLNSDLRELQWERRSNWNMSSLTGSISSSSSEFTPGSLFVKLPHPAPSSNLLSRLPSFSFSLPAFTASTVILAFSPTFSTFFPTDLASFLMFFLSLPPRLSKDPPRLPATLLSEVREPLVPLLKSATDPPALFSVAFTVNPSLSSSSPL